MRSKIPNLRGLWSGTGILIPELVDWEALAWSIVPGLGHLKTGRPKLGRILLPLWCALSVLTVLSIGTAWCRYFFAGMVGVHAMAVISLLAANLAYEGMFIRAAFGLLLFLCLHFFLYEPSVWLMTRFYTTMPVNSMPRGGVIAEGDGLLGEGPWLRPKRFSRGDVVLYRIDGVQTGAYVIRSGQGVERVVGAPGDRVQRVGDMLLVNGEPPLEGKGPLGRLLRLGEFDFQLGPSEYVIFATFVGRQAYGNVHPGQPMPASVVRHLSVVRYDDINGRILLRLRPFSRFGRIH